MNYDNLYIPIDKDSIKCVSFIDRHTIRVYLDNLNYNQNIRYKDIYLDEHYTTTETRTEWFWYNDQYNHANLPSCYSNNKITNDFYYRNDFDSILIIFFILFIFIVILPFKIFSRFFGRWFTL